MEIGYALVQFILGQETFSRQDLLHTDYALGVNQRVSALDIARREVRAFQASSVDATRGWTHLDRLQFWVRPPWTSTSRVPARFLEHESMVHEVSLAQSSQVGSWVFTDGSVQDAYSGARPSLRTLMVHLAVPPFVSPLGLSSRVLMLSLLAFVGLSPALLDNGIGRGQP